jgi:hypothetical protein
MTTTTTAPTMPAADWPDAPQSPGTSHCSQCGAGFDGLLLTRGAGICPRCLGRADRSLIPTLRSDPFWLLTPQQITRLELEIVRLAAEAIRVDETLGPLERELGWDHPTYLAAIDEYSEIESERLLLHMVHAASRQSRGIA